MLERFLEVLEKTRKGEIVDEKEWNNKIVLSEIREVLDDYDLDDTYDEENPINTDLSLVDDFWEAGLDLALRLGMYCPDTERRVKFSEDEILESFDYVPREFRLGSGKDQITIQKRRIEDNIPPTAAMSALGLEVREELYVPICQSIAQYEKVDMLIGALFKSIKGHEIRSRSPEETLAGMYEAEKVKEAVRKAGRPGMPLWGVEGAPTEYGHFGGLCPGGFEPERTMSISLFPEPVKLPYHILHRVAQAKNGGYPIEAGHMLNIYGYYGPPEGGVIGSIAGQLLQNVAVQPELIESSILDARYMGNAGRETLWAKSVSYQARARNSPIMDIGFISNVNGPATDMLLYETAVIALTDAVSGASVEIGTRPAACRYPNYCSSLENKLAVEVLEASTDVSLGDANHIVKSLLDSIPDYEEKLRNPNKGQSFEDCMNLDTLRPKKHWQDTYEEVWKELEDLGLPRSS